MTRTRVSFAAVALVAALSACAADPYNVFPDAAKVERIVVGTSALQVQEPRPGSSEYRIYEGRPIPDGGIVWQPFYLSDLPVAPSVGGAILARKARWSEVFGLLSRGAAGEASDNRLVPRVSVMELTERERGLIDAENRDRALVVNTILQARRIPGVDADAVRRVFAYTRYQQMPDGVWVERQPGQWVVKGGRDYRSRMMAREPVSMQEVQEPALEPMPEPDVQIEAPRPRLRR